MNIEQPECQELYDGEQEGDDDCSYPGKQKELRAETPQQVGYASWQADDIPYVVAIEKE